MTETSTTESERPRRRYAPRLPAEQRRDQLLDAALAVLADGGFDRLTMESVAQRAGVAKPVLYDLYGSRPDLLAALFSRERDRALLQIASALPADIADRTPDVAFADAIGAFVGAVIENPTRWTVILLPPHGSPAEFGQYIGRTRDLLVSQCQEIIEQGLDLTGVDTELLAHSLIGVAENLGRLALSDPSRFTADRLRRYARWIGRAARLKPLSLSDFPLSGEELRDNAQ